MLCFHAGASSPQAEGPSCAESNSTCCHQPRTSERSGSTIPGFRLSQLLMLTDSGCQLIPPRSLLSRPGHQSTGTAQEAGVPRTRKAPSAGGRCWLPHPQCLTGSCGRLSVPGSVPVLARPSPGPDTQPASLPSQPVAPAPPVPTALGLRVRQIHSAL